MNGFANADGLINAHAITQAYGRNEIIHSLNLQIPQGVFGLLGPNGSGKSTLLRTLATVAPPRTGRLEILGHEVSSDGDARKVRRHVGYLPQDFGFIPSFSVLDFVRYCAWLRRIPKRTAKRSTVHAVESVGLEREANRKMGSLSGGMLRRAGIAAAIVGRPAVILLDEPTVGLDPEQRLDFRNLLRELSDSAVILSTHLVEDVAAVCDRVVVMIDGTLQFRGTPRELQQLGNQPGPGDSSLERGYMAVIDTQKKSS